MLPTRICVAIIWPKLGVQGAVVVAVAAKDYISNKREKKKLTKQKFNAF